MKNVLPYIFSSSLQIFTSQTDGALRSNHMIVSGVLSFTFFRLSSSGFLLFVFLVLAPVRGATGPVANYALLALPAVCLYVPAEAST